MHDTIYTFSRIDGDYAILITASGDENRVARALLPEDACEGDCIAYKGFELVKEGNI